MGQAWLLSLAFLSLLGGLVFFGRLYPAVFGLYVLASLYAFLIYAVDKSAAKNGRWRISEKHLHLVSLMGGWPGALIARETLRHKSCKQSFRTMFLLSVFANGATLFLLVYFGSFKTLGAWIGSKTVLIRAALFHPFF
jgi:uncharacterized membrane protein YsdA (DUF1294 family)